MSGGNDDEPVSLFSQTDNSWVDAGKFFGGDDQQPLKTMPSASPTSSTTTSSATTSATSPAAAAGGGGLSNHDKMLKTLGITLGVLCGIAAVFIAALLYVRWRKMKQRKQEGYVDEKTGNRLSFADRGASFMKEAGGSIDHLAPPPKNTYGPGAGSHSSLAIIAGRIGGNKRNTNAHAQKDSFESTAPLRDKEFGEPMEMMDIGEKSPAIVGQKPVPQHNLQVPGQAPPNLAVFSASPEEQDSQLRNRSSGWSRYFATSQPNDNEHLPAAYTKDRQSTASEWPSSSTMSRIPSSALVPPLDIDFSKTVDGQRLSNVVTSSPAFSDSREDLARRGSMAEGQRAHIEGADRPTSTNTDVSSAYDRSTMSSDFYSGLAGDSRGSTPWTPVSNTFKDHINNRPTSSNYTSSIYDQRLPSRAARSQNSGFFPGSGTLNLKPAKLKIGHIATPSSDWATNGGAAKDSPLLKSPPAIKAPAPVHERDSTNTVFPRENANRWTANAPKDLPLPTSALKPPHPTNAFAPNQGMDRASTATVFPHDNGNRWTANLRADTVDGALQPPRAPALTGGASAAAPANDRDSTVTVFPHNDGGDDWTAGGLKAPHAPGLVNAAGQPSNDRDSTLTVFPRGVPSAYYANRPKEIDELDANKQPMTSDMSWLDLGGGGNRI